MDKQINMHLLFISCVLCFTLFNGGEGQVENELTDDYKQPEIYSLHVRSEIKFRFATTLIQSRVVNPSILPREVKFEVTLPEEAFISDFTLEIDGVQYPGEVKEKAEAKRDFDKAKKKGQSAGLLSQKPRDTRRFKIAVNVAAQSKVNFNVTYQELLERVRGLYRHTIYIYPGQPVKDLRIDVAIQESRDIKTLQVPPIKTDLLTNELALEENSVAIITRPTSRSALINYIPSVAEQTKTNVEGLAGQFVVEYDIARSLDAGDILVSNGYFVHFISPDVQTTISKDVLFILDCSGSMTGTKIRQLKEAMLIIMEDLDEGDRFNIMKFTGDTKLYKDTMIMATPKNIEKAKKYIQKEIRADGWTNIDKALLTGLSQQKASKIAGIRSPVMVFLTDGEASDGEQNTAKILQNVKKENEGGIPIFSLAFGKDADWDLVKKVAIQNDGIGRKIYEDSDSALQIAGFYDELAVTLLNNVTVKYLGDTVDEKSLTKSKFNNYFLGSEMVVAGRLEDINDETVTLQILGNSNEGGFVLSMDSDDNVIGFDDVTGLITKDDFQEITEKTWAYLTIKQILREADGTTNSTEKIALKQKALDLSLKYGFVTPLTSLVVIKPENDEVDQEIQRQKIAARPSTTTTTTQKPRRYYGGGGGGYSGGGGGDPHYMVRFNSIEHPICFDVRSSDGEIQNIITDPANGVTINTLLVGENKLDKYGDHKTFIGEVVIRLRNHVIAISPNSITYDEKVFSWKEERVKHFGGHEFIIKDKGRSLYIRFKFGAEVVIKRHIRNNPDEISYLNLNIDREDGFSKKTTGLIGQFVNGHKHILLKKIHTQPGGKLIAKFQIKEWSNLKLSYDKKAHNSLTKPVRHVVKANLVERPDVVKKAMEQCWMVHEQYETDFYGQRQSFTIDAL